MDAAVKFVKIGHNDEYNRFVRNYSNDELWAALGLLALQTPRELTEPIIEVENDITNLSLSAKFSNQESYLTPERLCQQENTTIHELNDINEKLLMPGNNYRLQGAKSKSKIPKRPSHRDNTILKLREYLKETLHVYQQK